ncbi:TetR/AcrR family transcriptional regulator [Microbacterium sp. NPDC089987]|uniref:TetR/AcrR family transcriptional regulator n=1 Tax=Microbacterium sp. NPDC089987 TaxID=3364202 RepID=UPI0038306C67
MAGRPRAFDRDQALLIAMERFWRDGYEATTISALTSAMGITPPSLYAAFGDKDRLFAAASALYVDGITAQVEKALALPTLREAITEMLVLTAAAQSDDGSPAGCFLATEPRLARERAALRERVASRIARAVRDGEVAPDTDPEQFAAYVMAVHTGLSSRARDGATTDELMAIVQVALGALPPA